MQRSFLERIRDKQDEGTTLAQTLSEVLSVSLDSAYRRIREEIPLTFMEITKLCQLYDISFDSVLSSKIQDNPRLKYKKLSDKNIEQDIRMLLKEIEKIFEHNDIKMYVLLTGIPIDRLAKRPELLMVYYNMCLKSKIGLDFPFEKKEVPLSIKELATVVYLYLAKIPATYIISPTWLVNFINDYSFFRKVGKINDREADLLREQMLELLNEMEIEAKIGSRSDGTEIEFLLSQISFDRINILIEADDKIYGITTLHNASFISSENFSLGREHRSWIEHIKTHSICISQSGALDRKIFFEKYQKLIKDNIT